MTSTLTATEATAAREAVHEDRRALASSVLSDLAELRAELSDLRGLVADLAWRDLERRIGAHPEQLASALHILRAGTAPSDPRWLAGRLRGLALYYDGACRGLSHWIPDVDRCVEMRETLARRQAHAHTLADRLARH